MYGIFQLYECPAREALFRALSSRIKLYVGRRGPRVSVFSYEQGYDIFDTSCLELPPARKRKAKGRPAHKVSDTQPKKRGRPKGSKNNKPAGGRHSTKSKAPARKSRNQASSSEGSSASGEEEDGGEMELGSEGEESDGGTGNSDDEPLNVRI
jgi:hypothetical protein